MDVYLFKRIKTISNDIDQINSKLSEVEELKIQVSNARYVYHFTVSVNGSESGQSDWSRTQAGDPWIANKSVIGLSSDYRPFIDLNYNNVQYAQVKSIYDSWSQIYRAVANDDELVLYAVNHPVKTLNLTIQVVI